MIDSSDKPYEPQVIESAIVEGVDDIGEPEILENKNKDSQKIKRVDNTRFIYFSIQ